MNKLLIKTLTGGSFYPRPIWFMRQAGRYLPEYRELREKTGSFLEMCFSPKIAKEVTLQPLKRFPEIDAAILFSDILVVPLALGYNLDFKQGEGPLLERVDLDNIKNFCPSSFVESLSSIFETIILTKKELPQEKALLGFAGAPWTLATYMMEGGGSKDHSHSKKMAFSFPGKLDELIAVLTEATHLYLREQVRAGVDAIQIFDSWAGVLPEVYYDRWVVNPIKEIVLRINKEFPHMPIILFPKGNPSFYWKFFGLGGCALSLESISSFLSIDSVAPKNMVFQGGLDPAFLVVGGEQMFLETERILRAFRDRPYIFNLGHGMTPDVPVSHVVELIDFVKNWRP